MGHKYLRENAEATVEIKEKLDKNWPSSREKLPKKVAKTTCT